MLLLGIAAVAAPAAFADTFVVNATDDPTTGTCTTSHCSLRQAIVASNATGGGSNTINFNLPESSFRCLIGRIQICHSTTPIQVNTALPAVTVRVNIDGSTQPNFDTSPLVEVRGPGTAGSVDGLVFKAGSEKSLVRSLAITSFRNGIVLEGSNSQVAGSRIGVDMNGAARGNFQGVVVEGDNNSVGGSSVNGDGNLISGNSGDGVVVCSSCLPLANLQGVSGSNNLIVGNLIGTSPNGAAAMGNQNGINIVGKGFNTQLNAYLGGVNRNIIGGDGTFSDYRNVISGNRASGIFVNGTGGTLIGGNRVGANAAGSVAIPNTTAGIMLQDTPNTFVGDFGIATQPCVLLGRPANCPLDRGGPNIISGNTGDGIRVFLTIHTHDLTILANDIGTDSTGSTALANGANGVNFTGPTLIGNDIRVGTSDPTGPNTIAFNTGAGVRDISGATIRFNHIFSNGGLGIDHANPTGASDAPFFTSVVSNSTSTTVSGNVNHVFSGTGTDTIDVYTNSACDTGGSGEGANYFGSFNVTSSSPLDSAFIQTLNAPLPIGTVVTLTSTPADNSGSSTTQFSQCQSVTSAGQTGTFTLTPRQTSTAVGAPVRAGLVWTVPVPRVWRNLATIDVRLTVDNGQTAMQIHWDEAANTFGLAGRPTGFAPGSVQRLETEWAFLDLATASVVGSGPTGPSVTLTLPITFKQHASGHTFTVAVNASDDLGHQDEFLDTGTWQVD
jgi:CSLREA domain-containing protein